MTTEKPATEAKYAIGNVVIYDGTYFKVLESWYYHDGEWRYMLEGVPRGRIVDAIPERALNPSR